MFGEEAEEGGGGVRHIATSPSTNKGTHAKDTTKMALSEAHRAGYAYHTTLLEQR